MADLAGLIAKQGSDLRLRQAIVTAAPSGGKCTIRFGDLASTTVADDIAGVHYLQSTVLLNGDTVWVLQTGGALVAIGPVSTNGAMYLKDTTLWIRYPGDAAHGLKYQAATIDGPLLFGNSGAALGDAAGGGTWDFRATPNGDCYARGSLFSASSVTAPNKCQAGQHSNVSGGGPSHLAGTGNDLHFDWSGGTFQHWVDVSNVKSFVIDHPLDPAGKYLIHACLEAPEALVQYRGQGQLVDGWVKVDLPDYFEALCAEDGRSVQLTCIADDPADEWCPVLHATYPKGGGFYVGLGSGVVANDQRFWWEVTAVRKDVAPLLVEPPKSDVTVHGSGPYTYYEENG